MRINFKNKDFVEFCKANGAAYYDDEEECGVWIIPKKIGEYQLGVSLDENGDVMFGAIDEDCKNFDADFDELTLLFDEIDWVIKTLTIFKKWKSK